MNMKRIKVSSNIFVELVHKTIEGITVHNYKQLLIYSDKDYKCDFFFDV